ncbi:hypothetical protein M1N44_03605 [Dehalococcoidia bacterium]|nr:hypothetical protein [Dehalococcoidia bacterium]
MGGTAQLIIEKVSWGIAISIIPMFRKGVKPLENPRSYPFRGFHGENERESPAKKKEVRKMPDREEEARQKGYEDGQRARERGNDDLFYPVSVVLGGGAYSPPSEHKEEYNAGFKDGKEGK